MMKTLQEMKTGAEPDESADYWEERKKIDQWTSDLHTVDTKLDKLQKVYTKKKADIDAAKANFKRINDIKGLSQHANDLEAIR